MTQGRQEGSLTLILTEWAGVETETVLPAPRALDVPVGGGQAVFLQETVDGLVDPLTTRSGEDTRQPFW